jgi:hypothetical protein
MHKGKIFVVGFPRTGTRSAITAIGMMGYRISHMQFNGFQGYDSADAFADTPVWCQWRELASRYVTARFVLTVREVESWWKSYEKNILPYYKVMIDNPLGSIVRPIDRDSWRPYLRAVPPTKDGLVQAYQRHNKEISEHFNGSDRFAAVDVSIPGDVEKVMNLVGARSSDLRFPMVK